MLYLLIFLLLAAIVIWVMMAILSKQKAEKRKARLEIIARLKPHVDAAFDEIGDYYNYGHYITETERQMLLDKYGVLDSEVKNILNSKELAESNDKELFQRFHSSMINTRAHKKTNNGHFIQNELSRCAEYFDNVLA